jgi:hypothetical protein
MLVNIPSGIKLPPFLSKPNHLILIVSGDSHLFALDIWNEILIFRYGCSHQGIAS